MSQQRAQRIVETVGPAGQPQPQPNLAPVGVFDSGVGGLTILHDLLRELPAERYIYFGDTGNCPYGVRSQREIQQLSIAAGRQLIERGAKIIVVACNTASVSALAELRAVLGQEFGIPFVGVVPAVKPAAEHTRTRKIGVAATEASARGDYLKRLIAEHAPGIEVLAVGCPRLVTLAEAGILEGPEAETAVREYIEPMLRAGIDQLVLGCTHFPAMRSVFERVAGPEVEVIDSGAAIARRTRFVLTDRHDLATPDGSAAARPRPLEPRDEFWCSGDADAFGHVASAILGMPVAARTIPGMLVAPGSIA
ncbi:MAG TPA: glutamate racemase [Ktedonobacterales bacterium]|nr:glutamate racemase [Ktedonobacterales bacterium]